MTEMELMDYVRGIHKLNRDELHKTPYPLMNQKDFFGKTYMVEVAQKIKNDNYKNEKYKLACIMRDKQE